MGILRRLREWREDKDGTLIGPNIEADSVDAGSVNTKTIANGQIHYVADYDGTDADARLTNALSAGSDDDTIYLENSQYDDDRTITKPVKIVGGTSGDRTGARPSLNADWTFDSSVVLTGLMLRDSASITINATRGHISELHDKRFENASITIDGSKNVLTGIIDISVTFTSNSSSNIIDSSSGASVTDNGSNTIGDIA